MALRIDENSISQGSIDNRKIGKTIVVIEFTDGFTMNVILTGNAHKDAAGRLLKFHHLKPDLNLEHHSSLLASDNGSTGDITAARKVKIPTISSEEFAEYYRLKIPSPYVWKNSLYLEWYSHHRGRCVLEASELVITSSEPEWVMTEEIEKQAHEDAQRELDQFFNTLGDIDTSRAELDKTLEKSDDDLNEYEWEKLFRHSDKTADRYRELLDKYGDDEDKINQEMGWDKETKNPEFNTSFDPPEDWQDQDSLEIDQDYEADRKAQKNHPIRIKAEQILSNLKSPNKTESRELGETWGAVATVCAKLAGAFSGFRSNGSYEDNGFVIAQLKRVLTYLNEAYELMVKINHSEKQNIMDLRQDIIDLQTKLRKL